MHNFFMLYMSYMNLGAQRKGERGGAGGTRGERRGGTRGAIQASRGSRGTTPISQEGAFEATRRAAAVKEAAMQLAT